MDKAGFAEWLHGLPAICSHSHHLPDKEHGDLSLAKLLSNSYLSWCGVPVPQGNDEARISAWLNAAGVRSYFVWLEKALMALYHINEPLSAHSWARYDQAIIQAHKDNNWHLTLLMKHCCYKAALLDAYWAPGVDNGHPELFKPVFRVNSLFYGYGQDARDHNGGNFQRTRGSQITDIREYIALVRRALGEAKASGCVAFKCALAYDRDLDFAEGDWDRAQKAFGEHPDKEDIRAFQNIVMGAVCEASAALNLPLQIHTGLGLMDRSDALQLRFLISRHPEVSFILMHGGYPWTADIAGLCHNYPNVWADLCWLPLISTAAAERLLDELIDVCNADRLIWGCDAWTGEESYAARLAFLEVLARVLWRRVDSGMMREEQARRFALMVLHDNALMLVSRAAANGLPLVRQPDNQG
ncbi:MAG: amidohydrolase family protein [Eubacteriales bacterium]|mgnify:CR=1 FL=1|nr:amidohydrolase family protein [Eubacteriales bacterium]MDD4133633.1 amidohydrolase family protein [Eubacteriales bacterium]